MSFIGSFSNRKTEIEKYEGLLMLLPLCNLVQTQSNSERQNYGQINHVFRKTLLWLLIEKKFLQ